MWNKRKNKIPFGRTTIPNNSMTGMIKHYFSAFSVPQKNNTMAKHNELQGETSLAF